MSDPTNVLDFLLRELNCLEDEDLIEALSNASPQALDRLTAAYHQFAASSWNLLPPLPNGELRPFIPTSPNHNVHAWIRGGFPFGLHELGSVDSTYAVVDKIKHRLLYCHSVAIDDPVWLLTSLAASEGRTSQAPSAALALRHYANLLLHLKDLVREQVVCPVFTQNLLSGSVGVRTRDARARLTNEIGGIVGESGDVDLEELLRAAPPETASGMREQMKSRSGEALLTMTLRDVASERIAMALCTATESAGRTSLYLPFRQDVASLATCFQRLASVRSAATQLPGDQSYVLVPLLDLQLPGLEALTPEAIVGIRRSGDEFAQWRHDLRQALLEAERVPIATLNRGDEMSRVVREHMEAALQRLERSVGSSSVLGAARVGGTAIVSGTLGAMATALLEPSGTAALITLGVVVGQLVGGGVAALAELGESSKGVSGSAIAPRRIHYVAMLR